MESRKVSNTIKNAKRGARYGGFFGLGAGMIIGFASKDVLGILGHSSLGAVAIPSAIGFVVCGSAGALVRTGLGFFSSGSDKANKPQNTSQSLFKV